MAPLSMTKSLGVAMISSICGGRDAERHVPVRVYDAVFVISAGIIMHHRAWRVLDTAGDGRQLWVPYC